MNTIRKAGVVYLEDISQAFFFRNAIFGVALLSLFLFFNSYLFICGLVSSLVGYAYTLRYSTPKLLKDSGLITINGFFFGIAIASLFHPSNFVFLALIFGASVIPIATKACFDVLQHWKLSVFVIPYILGVWVIWLCGNDLTLSTRHDIWPEVIVGLPPLHIEWSATRVFFDAIFRSIGRLLFFPNSAFGIWILALVTVFSPRRGFFLFAGTLIATGLACQLTRGSFAWEYGFFSYSAGLVGLGLASLPEKINWKTIFLVCVLSCFLTIAVDRLFRAANLPVLSLPYVLSMWVALLSRIPRVNMSWSHSKAPPIRVARLAQELEEVA